MNTDQEGMKAVAEKAISLLDLTNLNEDCTPQDIEKLCKRAQTPFGNTAAVCIWSRFVPQAKKLLADTGIRIATVVNFPAGDAETKAVVDETKTAIKAGAEEIDLVFPYRAFMAGKIELAQDQIMQVRGACKPPVKLKVIIEVGILQLEDAIRSASHLAIDSGADFIKTSTGKVEVNATPRSARIMLQAIADSGAAVGFKPAGGIKTTMDAANYLELAEQIMGENWASPQTLRFGASGVLDSLLATLNDETEKPVSGY